MTDTQYQLNSVLPFDISEHEQDVQTMLSAAPKDIWNAINSAEGHQKTVYAYDSLGAWIASNWKNYLV